MGFGNNNKGAVWLKTSKNGLKYMGGEVVINGQKYFISMFKNNKKTSEKHPDYNILVSLPGDKPAQQRQPQNDLPNSVTPQNQYPDPYADDSVPF
jgi:hypothetical protein